MAGQASYGKVRQHALVLPTLTQGGVRHELGRDPCDLEVQVPHAHFVAALLGTAARAVHEESLLDLLVADLG